MLAHLYVVLPDDIPILTFHIVAFFVEKINTKVDFAYRTTVRIQAIVPFQIFRYNTILGKKYRYDAGELCNDSA